MFPSIRSWSFNHVPCSPQPPQAQQGPLQIQPSIISQQAVAAAAAAAQQQYAAVPVSMVETGRQMLLTVRTEASPCYRYNTILSRKYIMKIFILFLIFHINKDIVY